MEIRYRITHKNKRDTKTKEKKNIKGEEKRRKKTHKLENLIT